MLRRNGVKDKVVSASRSDGQDFANQIHLPSRDESPRWKEIVEPALGHFMHHLELRDPAELDDEVHGWLRRAWEAAG